MKNKNNNKQEEQNFRGWISNTFYSLPLFQKSFFELNSHFQLKNLKTTEDCR